jgi:LDH2 family malate/lactate/ureidoglycolate dehydrogenase
MTESRCAVTETVIIDNVDLRDRVEALFAHVGVPDEQAQTIAEILVLADLRGIESHGVQFAPRYLRGLARGDVNPIPDIRQVGGRGAVAVIDADDGLGFIAASRGMETAIDLARKHGVGAVTVRHSNHFGMAGYYAMQAAEYGQVGHATTDGPAHTVLWGARGPVVCNDPIAWAFPTLHGPPVVIDTALTGVKEKIRLAAARGEPIPAGWAVDSAGRPTTDPEAALLGALLPIGGYKGSALIVANELLCGALAGARFSYEVPTTLVMGGDHDRWSCGHFLLALDPEAFACPSFLGRVAEFVDAMHAGERAADTDEILLPGEREWRLSEERRRDGLPIATSTIDHLDAVARELGANVAFGDLARVESH